MVKLLIGGSPCTHWSIAQKNNRETTASGIGWELFKNYLIAREKFQPDYFLYENNKSAAQEIKDAIKESLGAWDGTFFMADTGVRYIEINSALVSAQNRQRFYVHNCGDVGQPADRGILLKDILETGDGINEKAYCLTASYGGAIGWNTIERKQREMVAEPVCMRYERTEHAKQIRKDYENGTVDVGMSELRYLQPREDGKSNTLTTVLKDNPICEPIRIGDIGSTAQGYRVYSADGKAITQTAEAGGQGGKTGLYAVPTGIATTDDDKAICLTANYNGAHVPHSIDRSLRTMAVEPAQAGKKVYTVKGGQIEIKGKKYPIKLADGQYIIRKLTVTECCRLQTMPDDYCRAVPATQAYKGLGNGWTAEVVRHILWNAFKDIPKDEKIVVCSMYDGIATGRYILDIMGFTNVEYHAYEIDKYAIQIAMSNYPDIIQHGDAFQVRDEDWNIQSV